MLKEGQAGTCYLRTETQSGVRTSSQCGILDGEYTLKSMKGLESLKKRSSHSVWWNAQREER